MASLWELLQSAVFLGMTGLEIVGTVFGLLCVGLTIRRNIWCWPTGLVQVIIYAYIFYKAKLYSDYILHLIYIVMQIYGWHHWLRGGGPGENHLPISTLSPKTGLAWVATTLAGTAALGFSMSHWTDASFPYWDAFTTAASLVAQWLLARKILQNWLFWIAVDVVAIPVYIAKELYVTSGLYSIFLILATLGWLKWLQACRAQQAA
jgi:nicotinamide mononucleotide transporter